MVVKPATEGEAGIEHLMFRRAKNFDVINEPEMLARYAATMPAGFAMNTCVPVEQARVLAMRQHGSDRRLIVFGTQRSALTAPDQHPDAGELERKLP